LMKKHRLFYGWVIVGVSFLNLTIIFGIWYSFSVFFVAVIREFGWSRAATGGVFSCFMLVHSLAAVIVGSLFDRFGARIVIPFGGCVVALGLFASSRITELWQFYVWYGVITSVGVSAVGFIAHGIILPKWFDRKRGLAIGIAMAGIGFGMQILVPSTQFVIDHFNWRTAYCALAGVVLITIVPLNILLQRNNPQDVGQNVDGARAEELGENVSPEAGQTKTSEESLPKIWTIHSTLRSKQFWFLFFAFIFSPLGDSRDPYSSGCQCR